MSHMGEPSVESLSSRDFKRLAEFIQAHAGIKMPPAKRSMLEGRLRSRVRALGLGGLKDYCRLLFEDDGWDDEAPHLIDAVTTNTTAFFREPAHFRILVEAALPALASRGIGIERPLAAWSAAASIGAEAYSLAMVLADFAANFRFSVLGTDICSKVLEIAKAAIYAEQMIEPVPMEMRQRYLRRSKDPEQSNVRISPDLRSHVAFTKLNLIEGPHDLKLAADIVFCRNILIYFNRDNQFKALTDICRHLLPGGYFFVGHSESLTGFDLPLRQVAPATFLRT